jgi:hypothetical protein
MRRIACNNMAGRYRDNSDRANHVDSDANRPTSYEGQIKYDGLELINF